MAGTENATCGTCGHAMNEHAQTGCTVAGCACKVAGDSLSSDPGSAVAWAYSRTVWRDGGYRPTGATLAVLTPGSSMELRRSKAVELARAHAVPLDHAITDRVGHASPTPERRQILVNALAAERVDPP